MPATLPASYSSVALVYTKLPDIGSITTLTSASIAQVIGEAEAEINAEIAQKYNLPMTSEVPILTTLATDIAIYRLLAQRVFAADRLALSPWPDRYKEALTKLDRLAAGELNLVTSSGDVITGRSDLAEVWSTTMTYLPTMHEGAAPDMVQDEDKLDDIDDARDLGGVQDRLL